MFRLFWALSVHARWFLRRYMPTNILLDAIRARRGLRWGIPMMLLAVPYLYAASVCAELIDNGGPGWLHLLVMLFIYNAMKFTLMGPISLTLLLRTRRREHPGRRHGEGKEDRSTIGAGSLIAAGPPFGKLTGQARRGCPPSPR